MEDTVLLGDRIFVRLSSKPTPQRGDIIAFRYPPDHSQTYLKRVIGIPGDRIRLAAKTVYRNGVPLKEPHAIHKDDYLEPYRDNFPGEPNPVVLQCGLDMLARNVVNGEVLVPDGKYFVLGDNRDRSLDSRYFGFVPSADIIGRPVMIYDSRETPLGQRRWSRLFKVF